jgi:hypothetical protein
MKAVDLVFQYSGIMCFYVETVKLKMGKELGERGPREGSRREDGFDSSTGKKKNGTIGP